MEPLFQQDRPAMKKPHKQQTPSLKAVLGTTKEMMKDGGEPSEDRCAGGRGREK